jgi:hypothetical protein
MGENEMTSSLQPQRWALPISGGGWRITVMPPARLRLPDRYVDLTADQYRRYLTWIKEGVTIQDALPDLSAAKREVLLTGIGDDHFNQMFPEED